MSFLISSGGFRLPDLWATTDLPSTKSRSLQSRILKKRHILIVEDDEEILEIYNHLKHEKYWPLYLAKNSMDALSLLNQRPFDAMILDWNLPDFNADALLKVSDTLFDYHCEKYKYQIQNKIPVVTFSSENKKDINVDDSKYFYHQNHWGKPFKYDELKVRLEKLIYGSDG